VLSASFSRILCTWLFAVNLSDNIDNVDDAGGVLMVEPAACKKNCGSHEESRNAHYSADKADS
jgi:hypothetical protein